MRPSKKQGSAIPSVDFIRSQATKLSKRNRLEVVLLGTIFFLAALVFYLEVTSYAAYANSLNNNNSAAAGAPSTRASRHLNVRSSSGNGVPDDLSDFPDISTRVSRHTKTTPPMVRAVEAPRLEMFLQRIRLALSPFTNKYTKTIPIEPLAETSPLLCKQMWSFEATDKAFAPCKQEEGQQQRACETFDTLAQAKSACEANAPACVGVTQLESNAQFQLRFGPSAELLDSMGERSWRRIGSACPANPGEELKSTAMMVWNTFHDVVEGTLQDEANFHLLGKLYKTREDGSIFISISSYRDNSCADTLRKAFERASDASLLSVGIVQQNCVHPTQCHTGTGWGNTRRWVRSEHPDVDCARAFCDSDLGRPHCDAGRVRILRLDEIDAYGPFFSRFVNSKLWRGENFFLQIDAHTDFRSDWDVSMRAQMRATSNYPKSVISNYPLSGSASNTAPWPALRNPARPDEDYSIPSALCGCQFEHAGGEHYTVRLSQNGRSFKHELDVPKRSLFVAAGFFITHGEFVNEVGFDAFMPFLFMGEEIALSIRFYTNGYNIYAPSADVLRHEYVRKESPKFWESLGHTYSHGNIHNELTDLIVQRVQYLVTFPEADSKDKVSPANLLTKIDEFGLGKQRSADLFLRVSGMDLHKHKQIVPTWCSTGGVPPEESE